MVKVDFKIGNKLCDDYDLKESRENVFYPNIL